MQKKIEVEIKKENNSVVIYITKMSFSLMRMFHDGHEIGYAHEDIDIDLVINRLFRTKLDEKTLFIGKDWHKGPCIVDFEDESSRNRYFDELQKLFDYYNSDMRDSGGSNFYLN